MTKLQLIPAIAGVCALCAAPTGAQSVDSDTRSLAAVPVQNRPIRIHFANTDVSDVLQALSVKTHANIVFPAQIKKPISINLTAANLEDALNYVTGAAGLAYRKMGSTYIVAVAADLKQMLQSFGAPTRIALTTLESDAAVKLIEGALPYVTARPAGSQAVLVIGSADDLQQARTLLDEQQKTQLSDPMVQETVVLQFVQPSQVTTMLQSVFPTLKAQVVGSGAADKVGGTLVLAGPRSMVKSARQAILGADVSTTPQAPERVYRVYDIKYSSAPVLREMLDKAMPGVTVVVGPSVYSPPTPNFNPISAVSLGTSNSGGGSGGGTGGGSGGSGGGSGGSGGGSGGSSDSGSGGGGTSGGTSGSGSTNRGGEKAKTLVLAGTLPELDAALRLLEQVDIAPKQVTVDVKVMDVSRNAEEQLGLTYTWQPFTAYEQPPNTASGTLASPSTRPLGLGHFSRLPWQMQTTINALGTRNDSKILADPHIQVLDNDDASIFIGDTIRSQISQSSISGTTLQIVEIPVGIILLVRPRINADGKITLRVHPVVSTVTSITNGLPQTSSREAETTVMVQDGETMVIGGLIRDEMTKSIQEIPLLAKLPLVGELFRNRSTSHVKSDVLVFITPHLVK